MDKRGIAINQITAIADSDEKEFLKFKRKDMLENMDKGSPLYKRLRKEGVYTRRY